MIGQNTKFQASLFGGRNSDMPKFWKIKRELIRLARQTVEVPVDAVNFLFGSYYYDFFVSKNKQMWRGAQGSSPQKAVYLIFPVNGLLATHIRTLEYLSSKGLSVTVVSNIPLNPEDRVTVLKHCHQFIERPNFGYDFGGYRDGILSLKDSLREAEQLVLINDSVWFPIVTETDWLDDVRALDVDFAGAVSNYGMPRMEAENFRALDFNYRTDHKNFHYCSFALCIGKTILHDPGFLRFWKRFPLTNKKKKTVRRGEIGLTAWVLKRNFTHGETLGVAKLMHYLEALDDQKLADVASNVMIPEDPRLKALKSETLSGLDSVPRADLIKFILTAAARQGTGYALAYLSVFELGFPFLKKSPLWLDSDASDISIRILEKIDTPASREALTDARVLRKRLKTSDVLGTQTG
ncbi:MAG: rhamnan synthesis F family protein [Albidovulum sp.]